VLARGTEILAQAVAEHSAVTTPVYLDLERLSAIGDAVVVRLCCKGASGLPDEQLSGAIPCGVAKINVNTAAWPTRKRFPLNAVASTAPVGIRIDSLRISQLARPCAQATRLRTSSRPSAPRHHRRAEVRPGSDHQDRGRWRRPGDRRWETCGQSRRRRRTDQARAQRADRFRHCTRPRCLAWSVTGEDWGTNRALLLAVDADFRQLGQIEAEPNCLEIGPLCQFMRKCAHSLTRNRPHPGEGPCSCVPSEGGSACSAARRHRRDAGPPYPALPILHLDDQGPGFARPSGVCPRCAAGRAASWQGALIALAHAAQSPLSSLVCAL
jgi:hypothetical protein